MMKLRVLTWNVWFDNHEFNRRAHAMFRVFEQLSPDVICLQEVTPKFCHLLHQEARRDRSWLSSYVCTDKDFSGISVDPYSVMILCKSKYTPVFSEHEFPTEMNRKLLVSTICLSNEKFVHIGTVHLESLNYPRVRQQQLEVCAQALPCDSSILCGDFNFCSYK